MSNVAPIPKRFVIDRGGLPKLFPTHCHSADFWEHLGRAVATFGFLEEMLKKAIFAFTATRRFGSSVEAETAYKAWLPKLQKVLGDQLWNLAETYEKAVRDSPDSTTEGLDKLVGEIKEATKLRNVLCHGSWRMPDESGKSLPLFINRNDEEFQSLVDVEFLQTVQRCVADLSCAVIDSVTRMGWQFPGGAVPGKTILAPKVVAVPSDRTGR